MTGITGQANDGLSENIQKLLDIFANLTGKYTECKSQTSRINFFLNYNIFQFLIDYHITKKYFQAFFIYFSRHKKYVSYSPQTTKRQSNKGLRRTIKECSSPLVLNNKGNFMQMMITATDNRRFGRKANKQMPAHFALSNIRGNIDLYSEKFCVC